MMVKLDAITALASITYVVDYHELHLVDEKITSSSESEVDCNVMRTFCLPDVYFVCTFKTFITLI